MKYLKISELFSSVRNGASIKQDKTPNGIPITRIETIADGVIDIDKLGYASIMNDSFKNYYLEEGDILMSHINSESHLGKVAYFDKKDFTIIHGMNLLCLKANRELLEPIYAFYYFRTPFFKKSIKRITKKSVNQASFNISSLNDIQIPIPPLPDQIRIATILSKAEALIAQRKESIRLLDELLRSTFLEMFIEGNYTKKETTTIESLAKQEKGSMRTGPFGSDLLHSEFSERGDVKVVGIDNVVNNIFEEGEPRYISLEKYEKLKRYRIFPNDVLITIMGTTGRTAVVPEGIPLSINTKHIAAITLDFEKANPYFLSFSLRHNPYVIKQLRDRTRGAIMAGLNLGIIKSLKLNIPPIELQNHFAHVVEKVSALKLKYQDSLRELELLYKSLSQRAFKGELDLSKVWIEETRVFSTEEKPGTDISSDVDTDILDKVPKQYSSKEDYIKLYESFLRKHFSKKIFTQEAAEQLFNQVYVDQELEFDYKIFKAVVFKALKEKDSYLRQYFDEKEKRMELEVIK